MSNNPRLRGAALMGLVAGAAWWLGPEGAGLEPRPHAGRPHAASTPADRGARSASAPRPAASSGPPATFGSVWRADQVMVRVLPDADLEQLAGDLGLRVLRPAGRSGYASLGLPAGLDPVAALAALRADPRVRTVSPMGRVLGASDEQAAAFPYQWHHRKVGADDDSRQLRDSAHAEVVVAVLDTGVAYATMSHDGQQHQAAPSLAGSRIVAAWDFINDDPYALDDHQHGTHIASLIASDGQVMGGAPGVSLMPIKVLDANNEGTELALIEGLWHAYDNDADIVNLSLSFPSGYRPSAALLEVLEALHDAEQLIIAAAGNEGGNNRTWPAASPLVVSVAASGMTAPATLDSGRTPYSNFDGGVTLLCPGGMLDRDFIGESDRPDGYPDGLLGETIRHGEPGALGLWFMAGTSQAAAVATGMAAALLADGAHPSELRIRLADGNTVGVDRRTHLMIGTKRGPWPSIDTQQGKMRGDRVSTPWTYVAITPVLVASGTMALPSVWVIVRDAAMQPRVGRPVRIQLWADGETAYVGCTTDVNGACQATAVALGRSASSASLWQVQVHGVVGAGGRVEPTRSALAMNSAIDEAIRQIDLARPGTEYALGSYWSAGHVAGVGPLAAGYSVVNTGSGVSTSPFGVIATPAWISAQLGGAPAPIDGAAAGALPTLFAEITGSGIATSPFGFVPLQPQVITGSGIATSPFGFIPFGGPADPTLPSNATGPLTASLSGSSVGPHIAAGGFVNRDGMAGADVVSTAELEVQLSELGWAQAASLDAVELQP